MNRMYAHFKRATDLSLATLAIAWFSPILLGSAVLLKLTGEHKVIYAQKRVGRNYRPFLVFKFVTMRSNSEKQGTITAKNDPRVLPAGRLLRKSKINEFPQLFNVVLGQMSVIGPRPLVDSEVDMYPDGIRECIYDDNTPGLTGMGSIFFRDEDELIAATGKPPRVAYREDIMPIKGALELWYRNHKSPHIDAKIFLLTIWAIASSRTVPLERMFRNERGFPVEALERYAELWRRAGR